MPKPILHNMQPRFNPKTQCLEINGKTIPKSSTLRGVRMVQNPDGGATLMFTDGFYFVPPKSS